MAPNLHTIMARDYSKWWGGVAEGGWLSDHYLGGGA